MVLGFKSVSDSGRPTQVSNSRRVGRRWLELLHVRGGATNLLLRVGDGAAQPWVRCQAGQPTVARGRHRLGDNGSGNGGRLVLSSCYSVVLLVVPRHAHEEEEKGW